MKSLFNWIIKNAWNIFGVIGVAGTFYFSLMHVPDYVKEITTGKVNVIHESLMDDVQELLFYEKSVSIEDINSFIKGKELKQGVSYPYTPDELLVQIQERFMGNKFIPLEKRESLLAAIKAVRATYSPPETAEPKSFSWEPLASWLFSGLGVLIAAIGAASITRKLKIDKETEVDIVSGDVVINSHNSSMMASVMEFEKMVGEVLQELGALNGAPSGAQDHGYDFEAKGAEGDFIVEVKRYQKLLGLGTAREFMYKVNKSGKGGILVVSSGVTQRTKQLINEHNDISDNQKVHLVIGSSKSEVKEKLQKILATKASNKSKHSDAA
ncbi:hypothetical protein Q670_14180 [Alcanivorax sp. P2S70]|uniref:restriction endonuclease n=1 Tax=Alcanivorax sp. P2S70 TaxID=1397527 RepID=UPI0003B7B4FE|nr:restriction endonuclease [Alcanivorax sp. P2S70]ERP90041.1 hypothetical protein Q670_14180 [Alcanivorax sp. P2S70]